MRRSALASIGLLGCVMHHAPAWAADLPAVFKAAPAAVISPWTGFYVGAHLGYGWGGKTWIDNFPAFDGEIDADTHVQGALGGLQVGYNYQLNWLVLGIEGDFSWSDVKNDFTCYTFGDQRCFAKPEWFASVAGRVGVTNGPVLLYGKGGAVWTNDRFTNLATCAGTQPTTRDGVSADCGVTYFANQSRLGWLIGAGLEYRFARSWSIKLEYNHMDFGSLSVPFEDGNGNGFTEEIQQKVDVVKVGVNYYLDWGGTTASPISALGYAAPALPKVEERGSHVVAFTGFDVSKNSYSGLAGVLIAPFEDLETSGLRISILGNAGGYKYPSDVGLISGTFAAGDVLFGYGLEGDNYSITFLGGGNAITHKLSEIDLANSVQGTQFGAKLRADAWINPTPQTLTQGEAEYSTAFQTYYTRLKLGYDITTNRRIFLGPEVAALGDERSHQWRVGAHVTQLKFGRIQVDFSAGYAKDSIVGASAYTNIELSTNF